jgi:hypothetical protein
VILAHIVHEGHSDDLIGPQELPALPPIGAIISVLDRNSNNHRIKVTSVELFANSPDPERKAIQIALSGDIRIRITGTTIYDRPTP